MKKNKGFTLIELLAVIVILAIIAVIAVPIVLNIVEEAEISAKTSSATNYVRALENKITMGQLNKEVFTNGTYSVTKEGKLCSGLYYETKGICYSKEYEIDFSGEVPTGGEITISDSQILKSKFIYEDVAVIVDTNKGATAKIIEEDENNTVLIDYNIGQMVIFDPGDGVNTNWYVIDEDKSTVTLLLSTNLGENIKWINKTDYDLANTDGTKCNSYSEGCTDEGPITALNYLNELTKDWNVEPIKRYSYNNNEEKNVDVFGYQNIKINNGKTIITDFDGNINYINGETKARLLTLDEFFEIAGAFNENLSEKGIINWLEINFKTLKENNIIDNPEINSIEDYLEVIAKQYGNNKGRRNASQWLLVALIVATGYDSSYNLAPPQMLYTGTDELEYLMITTSGSSNINVLDSVHDTDLKLRPVITISKTKLK